MKNVNPVPLDASNLEETKDPIQYFSKYFPHSFFDNMAEMTNIYSMQSDNKIKPTNTSEITGFVGLHILMGCLSFPRIRMYWDRVFNLDLFRNTMSRNRFFQLRTNLHVVNNLEKPQKCTDKLYKVRPIFDNIKNRCNDLAKETKLCVDEQIVPFTGRLEIKQYVKNKPSPWGIKIFVLCGESGTAYDFILYQGSTTEISKELLDRFGLGASVVLHLAKNIPEESYLYFDNYFSTYLLFEELYKKKIYSVGTIRIDRFQKPPFTVDKQFTKKDRGYSEEIINDEGTVVLCKWQDNKPVTVGSNFVGKGKEDLVERWDKNEKKIIKIQRPQAIQFYNKSMGGVDILDQLLAYYRIFIKSKKWTLRLIFHGFDFACVNSWLEYKREQASANIPPKEVMDLLQFKIRIAEALIRMGKPIKRNIGHPKTSCENSPQIPKRHRFEVRPIREIQNDRVDHMPEYDNNKEASRCKYTSCKGKTHVYCLKCNVIEPNAPSML